MSKSKCSLVEVKWLDHCGLGSWSRDFDIKPTVNQSVGYVIRDMPDFLHIAASFSGTGQLDGQLAIIKTDIVSMKVLVKNAEVV